MDKEELKRRINSKLNAAEISQHFANGRVTAFEEILMILNEDEE